MKKTLVAAILGLGLASTVFGQGIVQLYNYQFNTTLANEIKFGAGSGGTLGASVNTSAGNFTVGLYWALSSSVSVSAANTAMTGDGGNGLIPLLSLAAGATAPLGDESVNNQAGQYAGANISLGTAGQFPTDAAVTLVVVAYNGADYASSTIRGHSAAFSLLASAASGNTFVSTTGSAMPGFSVSAVPEPSTFALAGLGLASLLIFRRRK